VRAKRFQNQRTSFSSDKSEEKASFLTNSDIFRHLNPEEISELEHMTTVITCPPGRVLYRPGERGMTLFWLQSGCIQLYHLSTDGRKLIIATLGEGDCFGEVLLLGQDTYNCFAEAVNNSTVCGMNKHDIEQILAQKPAVAFALLQKLGQRFVRLESQLLDTAFKGTLARLATLLLHLARPQMNGKQTLVVDGLSHEELAERLGVYRETVSTALRDLKETGAIELGRKHITIIQQSLLETIAKADGKGA